MDKKNSPVCIFSIPKFQAWLISLIQHLVLFPVQLWAYIEINSPKILCLLVAHIEKYYKWAGAIIMSTELKQFAWIDFVQLLHQL